MNPLPCLRWVVGYSCSALTLPRIDLCHHATSNKHSAMSSVWPTRRHLQRQVSPARALTSMSSGARPVRASKPSRWRSTWRYECSSDESTLHSALMLARTCAGDGGVGEAVAEEVGRLRPFVHCWRLASDVGAMHASA